MGFSSEACAIIARKWRQGKRLVLVPDDDTLLHQFTEDRTNLLVYSRVNVAFLTPQEYRRWRRTCRAKKAKNL
jgi:hypothetical protein